MRMRTLAETMTYIKSQDPQTALTPCALRSMVLSGKIPFVQVGRKRLIDLDTLNDYLLYAPEPTPTAGESYGTIRPVRIAK